jgi:hypothetical protein
MSGKKRDLTNQRFAHLLVLSFAGNHGRYRHWLCRCDCGNLVAVSTNNLTSGNSTRCTQCRFAHLKIVNAGHGLVHTPEYNSWRGMLERCRNTKHAAYKNYGQRGISVCEQWHNFEIFLHDMGLKPSPKHTLERNDNNGNYTPENCVWALREKQANNRRGNHLISYDNRTQSLASWAREYNLNYNKVRQRLTAGYTFEEAIQPHPRKRK